MENQIKVERIESALNNFLDYLSPEMREDLHMTEPYHLVDSDEKSADWPLAYKDVLKTKTGKPYRPDVGVYLLFDREDALVYVGMSVASVGHRLGRYFNYGPERACQRKEGYESACSFRVVFFESEQLGFLIPALECYLIDRLGPPINIRGKRAESIG